MPARLFPCPFCGGDPKEKHSNGWDWIECSKCGAKGPAERMGHGGNADDAWNKRVPIQVREVERVPLVIDDENDDPD